MNYEFWLLILNFVLALKHVKPAKSFCLSTNAHLTSKQLNKGHLANHNS
jgi:hypothetical protein